MPTVMPSRSSATTSASVVRLSLTGRSLVEVGVALVDERLPRLVAHPSEVELEREALLEAVAALDVDRIDPVERLLGGANDGRALGRDLFRDGACGGKQF